MSEIFSVGDTVSYHDGSMGTALTCEVVRVMPAEGNSRTYRIRDNNERFERAVPGFTLTLISGKKPAASPLKPSVSAKKR
jgi:hypothetical protein